MSDDQDLWDGPPFEVDGDRTEFSLTIFGAGNYLYYPLVINQMYNVDVSLDRVMTITAWGQTLVKFFVAPGRRGEFILFTMEFSNV